jgi:hypothetical protein
MLTIGEIEAENLSGVPAAVICGGRGNSLSLPASGSDNTRKKSPDFLTDLLNFFQN